VSAGGKKARRQSNGRAEGLLRESKSSNRGRV
jgi:hypothetical protein